MNETPKFNIENRKTEDKDLIDGALQWNLSDLAHQYYNALFSANQDEFRRLIAEFNSLDPDERGKEKYDHDRPLTEHVERSTEIRMPSGYPLTVTLEKNGTITLATSL
jgi:hypothetical protein